MLRLEWGCRAVQAGAVENVCHVLSSHMEDGILFSSCLRALALLVRCGARESDDVCSRMLECTKTFLKNCEAGPSVTEEAFRALPNIFTDEVARELRSHPSSGSDSISIDRMEQSCGEILSVRTSLSE